MSGWCSVLSCHYKNSSTTSQNKYGIVGNKTVFSAAVFAEQEDSNVAGVLRMSPDWSSCMKCSPLPMDE